MTSREQRMRAWAAAACGVTKLQLTPASGDASFRRYFRLHLSAGETRILMDAPPDKESSAAFAALAERFAALGIHVPEIHAADLDQGFMLLEDLGTQPYLDVLNDDTVDRLYGDALGALLTIQARGPLLGLPAYDRPLLKRELGIFTEWLLGAHLGLSLSSDEQRLLNETFESLIANALEQPCVCVHRDFHSRNLMVSSPPMPGVLDFQDAVAGPVTYDLVSLLRDCYVAWPQERVEQWVWGYFELAVQSGVLGREYEEKFLQWFDLMGVQRHLKAAGIFARLYRRDGKSGYLKDIPRTLGYLADLAPRRSAIRDLASFVAERVLPALDAPGDQLRIR